MGFLRDPIWQFIGTILTLIALLVTVVLFFLQRRKKSLAYEILSEAALLTMKEGLEGKIQILFEGQDVKNVYLLVIKIINNGNTPISSSDFENTLTFIFSKDSNILSAEIINTNPKTLKPTFIATSNKLIINPILLNNGDAITFKLLLTQYGDEIEVDARIIGVKEVKKATEQPAQSLIMMIAGTVMTLIGWAGLSLPQLLSKQPIKSNTDLQNTVLSLLFIVLFLIGYFLVIYAPIKILRYRKSFKKYISKKGSETKS